MASSFSSIPSYNPGSPDEKIDRCLTSYTPRYQRFMLKSRSYSQQYSHIYTKRISQMRELVLAAAKAKWKDIDTNQLRECRKVIDLRPGESEWLVIGCIYKDQPLKPSILDEYSGDRGLEPPIPRANYSSDADGIVLEDESGRVALSAGRWAPTTHGNIHKTSPPHRTAAPPGGPNEKGTYTFPLNRLVDAVVTGIVLAVRGTVLETGELAVCDVCVPGLTMTQPWVPRPLPPAGEPAKFVLLLSGLKLNSTSDSTLDAPLATMMLMDYVTGMMSSSEASRVSRIVRVVVAGDLIGKAEKKAILTSGVSGLRMASGTASGSIAERSISGAEQAVIADPMKDADMLLAQLASSAPVDVMPGECDPANLTLPQQPLHPVLFPTAARYSSFRCVSNPYDAEIGSCRFLGSSGQPVLDIARYARHSTPTVPGDEVGLKSHHVHWVGGEDDHLLDASGGVDRGVGSKTRMQLEGEHDVSFRGTEEESDVAPDALVHAISSTSSDRSLAMIAGTGAGAGYELRSHASGTESEQVRSSLSELELLTNTLYWRHMAPTCPDTLGSYPFYEYDPFVIDEVPDVLFSGGCNAFGTTLVNDVQSRRTVRVIAIPDFSRTCTAVLVNISSPGLECQPIVFGPLV